MAETGDRYAFEPDTSVLPPVWLGGLSRLPRRVRRLYRVGVRFTAGGIGRLLVGNLSDRVDSERPMSVSFLLCGGGVFGGAVTEWLVTLTSWPVTLVFRDLLAVGAEIAALALRPPAE